MVVARKRWSSFRLEKLKSPATGTLRPSGIWTGYSGCCDGVGVEPPAGAAVGVPDGVLRGLPLLPGLGAFVDPGTLGGVVGTRTAVAVGEGAGLVTSSSGSASSPPQPESTSAAVSSAARLNRRRRCLTPGAPRWPGGRAR